MNPIVISGDILCENHISGIPRYTYEIVQNLDRQLLEEDANWDIRLCYPAEKVINIPQLHKIHIVPLETSGQRFASNVLRKYVKINKGILCNMANGVAFSPYGVVCIHDIRALEEKEYDCLKQKIYMSLLRQSTKIMHTKIVTVSNYQKRQIGRIFNASIEEIDVIPNGWEHIASIEEDTSVFSKYPQIEKGDYFYSMGSVARHKNYKWVHEVAKRNKDKLFVVGGNIEKNVWGIDDTELKQKNVIFLGYISDEENKALMANCRAFLHPSKYEGFGIPPLEALALGKKIIISNATCLPEIYKDSAVYFDPDDYDVNLSLLENKEVSGESEILAQYTWKNSARMWLDLFKMLVEVNVKSQ